MSIDPNEIKKIAKLAHLELDEKFLIEVGNQFQQIMGYFDKVSQINTHGVEPLISPIEIISSGRNDEVKKSISTDELLKNTPDRQGNLIRVPPVV